jgi:beta-lactamase regulating signal transducer with metallopeptidase domain
MENLMNILPSNVTNALGWTLLNSLWQAVALLIIYNVYCHFSASTNRKYNVGLLLLATQIIISTFTFAYFYEPEADAQTAVLNKMVDMQFDKSAAINTIRLPFYFSALAWLSDKLVVFVNLWIIGLVFYIIRFGINLWEVNQLKTSGLSSPSLDAIIVFDKLLAKVKTSKMIKLMESVKVTSPVLIGHFKCILLLPVGLCIQLSPNELEAILAHELAHLKRNDFLVNLLQTMVDILFFFNPVIQYLSHQIRIERENSCDEFATEICGSRLPVAKALVSLEAYRQENTLAMAFGRRGVSLKIRVQKILGIGPEKANKSYGIVPLILVLLSTIIYFNSVNLFAKGSKSEKIKGDSTLVSISSSDLYFPIYAEKNNKKLKIKRNKEFFYLNDKVFKISKEDSDEIDLKIIEIKSLRKSNENIPNLGTFSVKVGDKNIIIYHLNPSEIDSLENEILLKECDIYGKLYDEWKDKKNSVFKNNHVELLEKLAASSEKIEKITYVFHETLNSKIKKMNIKGFDSIDDYQRNNLKMKRIEYEINRKIPAEILKEFRDLTGAELIYDGSLLPAAPPTPPAPPKTVDKPAPPAPPEPPKAPKKS